MRLVDLYPKNVESCSPHSRDLRTMITLYLLSRGSTSVLRNTQSDRGTERRHITRKRSYSRKSIPSVKYLIRVRSLSLTSSKRIVYPTWQRGRVASHPSKKRHVLRLLGCSPLLARPVSQRRLQRPGGAGYKQPHCRSMPTRLRKGIEGALYVAG